MAIEDPGTAQHERSGAHGGQPRSGPALTIEEAGQTRSDRRRGRRPIGRTDDERVKDSPGWRVKLVYGTAIGWNGRAGGRHDRRGERATCGNAIGVGEELDHAVESRS